MSDKILTVIVPSYNMEKYLPKCLGSLVVAPELMEKLEVLVVNDGSRDRTSEIAHEYATKYPQTYKVIDKLNGHYGSCINAGLAIAGGAYVKILDADDSFDTAAFSRYFEKVVSAVDESKLAPDLILNAMVQVDEDDKGLQLFGFNVKHNTIDEFENARLMDTEYIYMHQVAYKLDILKSLKYKQTEGICYTDNEWVHLPMSKVRLYYSINEPVYRYLVGRAGQSVDSAVSMRNFHMWLAEAKVLMDNCASAQPLSISHAHYLMHVALSVLYKAYSFILKTNFDQEKSVLLKQFDLEIQEDGAWDSRVIEQKVSSRLFDFYYVEEWRRRYSKKTFKFSLFRLYQSVLSIRDALRRCMRHEMGR